MPIATSFIEVLRRLVESAQYAFRIYREMLTADQIVGPMTRRGNPYGNARAKRFMKTLVVEAVYPMASEN